LEKGWEFRETERVKLRQRVAEERDKTLWKNMAGENGLSRDLDWD